VEINNRSGIMDTCELCFNAARLLEKIESIQRNFIKIGHFTSDLADDTFWAKTYALYIKDYAEKYCSKCNNEVE
jgi:hypothetical protein